MKKNQMNMKQNCRSKKDKYKSSQINYKLCNKCFYFRCFQHKFYSLQRDSNSDFQREREHADHFTTTTTHPFEFTLRASSLQFKCSVTRLGESSPLWPDFKSLWQFLSISQPNGQILNLLWYFFGVGQIFIFVNCQILNK